MIICADDYGISDAVSKGIIELIDGGRITATSCMVTGSKNLQRQMAIVTDRKDVADIGLHLTLTNDRPLTDLRPEHGLVERNGCFLRFNQLLSNCYRGRVDRSRLDGEIRAQMDRFEALTGFPPAFIDGHQHVQQLPIVGELLLRACRDQLQSKFYIRCGNVPAKWLLSGDLTARMKIASALIALPAIGFSRKVKRNGLARNNSLLGHYGTRRDIAFGEIFDRYVRLGPEVNDIFYAHPGYADDELRSKDTLVDERILELEFLRSPQFFERLDKSRIRLNRFHWGSSDAA